MCYLRKYHSAYKINHNKAEKRNMNTKANILEQINEFLKVS